MKIAITGKGGVGKTTVCALLCREYSRLGRSVLAVDADPDSNLAGALGFPGAGEIRPIAELKDLIRDRAGERGGGLVKLNPRVDDIPATHSAVHGGIRLVVLGGVSRAGGGCACPENIFLKELLGHILTERDGIVLVDMEAGVEHLGRATAKDVDLFVIITEPSMLSLHSARRISELARDLGIEGIALIANKISSREEIAMINRELRNTRCLGFVPFSNMLRNHSLKASEVAEDPVLQRTISDITKAIIQSEQEQKMQSPRKRREKISP
jgi:CO dehydrogenase maturation factor